MQQQVLGRKVAPSDVRVPVPTEGGRGELRWQLGKSADQLALKEGAIRDDPEGPTESQGP